jgi:hypothetical protein
MVLLAGLSVHGGAQELAPIGITTCAREVEW